MSNSAGPKIIKDSSLVLNFDASNKKSYAAAQDLYVNNVSLMLDGESLVDKSQNGFTITNSNVALNTSNFKYGNSSLYFNGTTSYLSLNGQSAFSFGTGDFTIETWYLPSDTNTEDTIYDTRPLTTNSTSYFTLRRKSDASLSMVVNGVDVINGGATTLTWQHVALCRSSGTTRLFLNGTQVGSSYSDSNSYAITSGRPFIGAESYTPSNNTFTLTGYLDDFRVTKSALYISNFTLSTGPLRLPGIITDLTINKNIGTFVNSPTFDSSNGGCISFTTSYISSPSASVYQLGANNFTFESWIYLNAYPLASNGVYTAMIMCKDQLGSRGFNFSITGSSSANTALLFGGFSSNSVSQNAAPAYPFQLNTWYHVTASRVGNLLYMYVNGNLLNAGGTSFTTTIQSTTSEVRIAAQVYSGGYNYYVNGKIAIMKLYNGRGLTSGEVYNNFVANRGRFGV